jgi:hypothetical protein
VADERREEIVLSSSDEEGAAGPARSRRPRDVEAHVLADFEEVRGRVSADQRRVGPHHPNRAPGRSSSISLAR